MTVGQLAFRATDPSTSREAAAVVRAGAREHEQLIVRILESHGPLTHEQIADEVEKAMPDRWTRGSTVTACHRCGLVEWDRDRNARGRTVIVWALDEGVETIRLTGEQL